MFHSILYKYILTLLGALILSLWGCGVVLLIIQSICSSTRWHFLVFQIPTPHHSSQLPHMSKPTHHITLTKKIGKPPQPLFLSKFILSPFKLSQVTNKWIDVRSEMNSNQWNIWGSGLKTKIHHGKTQSQIGKQKPITYH